jgi:tetratricopeptide (TPR) repeat protein
LKNLVATGNQSPEILNDLGVAQFQLQNYDEAIASFSKALEKSPDYTEALFNRALAEQEDDRIEAAKQDWQRFIHLSSDQDWKTEAQGKLNMLNSTSKLIKD